MAKRYSKAAHSKRRKQTSHVLKNTVILLFCAVGIWFGSSLWHAALTLQTVQPAESIAGEEFRPQVGDPPYRVVIDAGHGGADPGARGVIEEKDMTAATASELIRLLQQDSNFIPLQTRDSFDETATPAQRAARADEQAPQLLLSIHGNSAANGSTASGFECYPAVPGRTWHQESFYFAQLLAKGMQAARSISAWARGSPIHLLSGKRSEATGGKYPHRGAFRAKLYVAGRCKLSGSAGRAMLCNE